MNHKKTIIAGCSIMLFVASLIFSFSMPGNHMKCLGEQVFHHFNLAIYSEGTEGWYYPGIISAVGMFVAIGLFSWTKEQSLKTLNILFTDNFVTKTADCSEEEKNQIRECFNHSNETVYSSDDETYKPVEFNEVYYLAEEYAEKFKDRNYLLNLSKEEEDRIYEEMKAVSVLLWERRFLCMT